MSDQNDWHNCHFCGDYVKGGLDTKGNRHWLSNCRPDLVDHEIGETCTWSYDKENPQNCYAYQDLDTLKWANKHIHFYKDRQM